MKLEKIDFSLKSNEDLGVCEKVSKADESFSYSSIVGFFGKNGAGKTRALNAVRNTIEAAIENNEKGFLKDITGNAKSKILFLDSNTIIQIKNKSIEPFKRGNYIPFEETLINSMGMQEYLINHGKSLLTYMGLQWYEIENLSPESPAKIFSEMFKKIFNVEFRTIFDPVSCQLNLQVDSLNIDTYELSDGEWIIVFYLLLVTLVKCTDEKFSDAIVIIDELENYLNPANIRKIFSFLCDAFERKGQIWVASHSLDVLLLIDSKKTYRLEKSGSNQQKKTNIYKPNFSNFNKIRLELFGDDENVITGLSFREDEIQHYFSQFMAQSLKEPTTVKCISKNDIQLNLFLECLDAKQEVIKILDFGAGEGRIGEALKDQKDDRIWYYAYEINKEKAPVIMEKQYAKEVYTVRDEITKSFDIILLCNVLHEIDVLEWKNELNFILDRLSEKGILVFIEDLELPVGEYIGEKGFLLLDGEMTKVLFGDEHVSLLLAKEEKYRERILCAAIDRNAVITTENIIRALELMKKRNIEKIWQIRRNKKDKFVLQQNRLGVMMARASQLVVNSNIAIEYLKSIDAASRESMDKFIGCFVESLGFVNLKSGMMRQEFDQVMTEVWNTFAAEYNQEWFLRSNIALTGSLLQRLNHILAKVNLKIYNENFGKLCTTCIQLHILEKLKKEEYKNLMTHLVFLDLNNKIGMKKSENI